MLLFGGDYYVDICSYNGGVQFVVFGGVFQCGYVVGVLCGFDVGIVFVVQFDGLVDLVGGGMVGFVGVFD